MVRLESLPKAPGAFPQSDSPHYDHFSTGSSPLGASAIDSPKPLNNKCPIRLLRRNAVFNMNKDCAFPGPNNGPTYEADLDQENANGHAMVVEDNTLLSGDEYAHPCESDWFYQKYQITEIIRDSTVHNKHTTAAVYAVRRRADKKMFCTKQHSLDHLRTEAVILYRIANQCRTICNFEEFKSSFVKGQDLARLVMEYFPQGSLLDARRDYHINRNLWPESKLWRFLLDTSEALDFLQTGRLGLMRIPNWSPILHADLKPDNIMLQGNTWKLIDFGLSLKLVSDGPNYKDVDRNAGTPKYVPPEFPQTYGTKRDVWTLGAILHELCTGELPRDEYSVGPNTLTSPNGFQVVCKMPIRIHRIYDPTTTRSNQRHIRLRKEPIGVYTQLLHMMMTWMLGVDPYKRPSAEQVHATIKHHHHAILSMALSPHSSFDVLASEYSAQLAKLWKYDPCRAGQETYRFPLTPWHQNSMHYMPEFPPPLSDPTNPRAMISPLDTLLDASGVGIAGRPPHDCVKGR
jgi:serine/threonine protein kinase